MSANWFLVEDYAEQIKNGKAFANIWTIRDVKSLAPDLTDEEAMDILERVEMNFDANIGINWDVIQKEIDDYIWLHEEAV